MRADAEANRERVLDAASEVFAEEGIDAPLVLVADRAGVGKGTLYRHFADRDALVLGLADRLQASYAAMARDAENAPTGWDGLQIYIDRVLAMYFELPWMVVVRARARRLASTDGEAEKAFTRVIERAWNEGSLRKDVGFTDLAFVTTALGGLAGLPESIRPGVVARMRDILFDGLRAQESPRLPISVDPLDIDEFREYTLQLDAASGE